MGLCEEGLIKFIKPGNYGKSIKNKSYAIKAVNILKNRNYSNDIKSKELWNLVMDGEKKSHNSQMNVVLALWNNGFINKMFL